MKKYLAIAAPLAALVLGAGCSQQTINSANKDAQHDITVLNQKAKQVASQAKPQLKKLDLGTRVTAALAAAHVQGVRVDAEVNGVSLHGTVDTPEEKQKAERIARDTLGPDKTVDDQLKVKGQ